MRRKELAARYLRMLLNDRGAYRARWACLVDKDLTGEISQAAVAKVIVNHLRASGVPSGEISFRLLKDRVCRALSGRALTPATLALFTAAFGFIEDDARQLWALLLGTDPGEAQAALDPPADAGPCELSLTAGEAGWLRVQLGQPRPAVWTGGDAAIAAVIAAKMRSPPVGG